ncbi:hypothetical protein X975_16020, partial [Stegodyphus mimosarum]
MKDVNEVPTEVDLEALKKQQALVNYLRKTLNFAEVIHGTIEPVCSLLHSSTQTDILEAIEFFTAAAAGNAVKSTNVGIKEILNLVWSKEA